MLRSIDGLLQHLVTPTRLWRAKLLASWKEIMGPLYENAQICKITEDSVTIKVDNACLLQELSLLQGLLLEKINQTLDSPRIKVVQFRLGKQTTQNGSHIRSSQKKEKQIDDRQYALIKQITVGTVDDPELQEVLLSFGKRCLEGDQWIKNTS
jgi:hypothetical protein